ncbi:MAG TPA: hypothetical protein VGS19_02790 [Streptosporangiaceae bacterium]|nr:hypothetical protein [Streptosporangiaceae bacterium]
MDLAGLIIAAGLLAVGSQLSSPARDVFLGIATSFVFITALDLLISAQRAVLNHAAAEFFGGELVRRNVTFVYPDFEPHQEVTDALKAAGIRMRYQRPTSKIRGFADFWIDAPFTTASNDIEAILHMATCLDGLGAGSSLMTDRKLLDQCDCSFLSFGLWSSACTYLYLERVGQARLFELLPEPAAGEARMYARTRNGREFHSSPDHQFAMILRYAPDRLHQPQRRWWLIGGLGPEGTIGAAWYLSQKWRYLAGLVPATQDFVAFVCVPTIAPTTAYFDEDNDLFTS